MKASAAGSIALASLVSAVTFAQAPPPPGGMPPAPPPPAAGMAPTAPAPQAFPTAPAASPTYTGDTVINSAPLLGVGIALTAIGFVGSIVGITVAGNAEREDPCYFDPCDDIDFGKRAAGLVVGFVSLGLAAAGIPMIAVGARQVPEVGQPPRARVYLGPGSLRVTW